MKKVYLLNPGAADELRIREHLGNIYYFDIAKDISKIAKRSIYAGSLCDLSEIFNNQSEGNKKILLEKAFDIVEETNSNLYLKLR